MPRSFHVAILAGEVACVFKELPQNIQSLIDGQDVTDALYSQDAIPNADGELVWPVVRTASLQYMQVEL